MYVVLIVARYNYSRTIKEGIVQYRSMFFVIHSMGPWEKMQYSTIRRQQKVVAIKAK